MTFFVSLIAMMIERFFDWSHLRHWHWYYHYQNLVIKKTIALRSYLILPAILAPLVIVTYLFQFLIAGILYGFLSLLFQLSLLLYCLGPQNLWADAFACFNALNQGDKRDALDRIKSAFHITDKRHTQSMHRHFLDMIFIEANQRVFAILFWFIILGPVGPVIYRAITLTAAGNDNHSHALSAASILDDPQLVRTAREVVAVFNWLPIRLMILLFALCGHFVQVIGRMRKEHVWSTDNNENLLTACGFSAIGLEEKTDIPSDCSVEKQAIGLIDRSLVVLLVIIALIQCLS